MGRARQDARRDDKKRPKATKTSREKAKECWKIELKQDKNAPKYGLQYLICLKTWENGPKTTILGRVHSPKLALGAKYELERRRKLTDRYIRNILEKYGCEVKYTNKQ